VTRRGTVCRVCGGELPYKKVFLCCKKCAEKWAAMKPRTAAAAHVAPEIVARVRALYEERTVLSGGFVSRAYSVTTISKTTGVPETTVRAIVNRKGKYAEAT